MNVIYCGAIIFELTCALDSLGFEATPVKKDFERPIYLDMQATSPTDPRVLDAMLPYMTELYGNPHSRTHKYGWETEQAVEKAREVSVSLILIRVNLFLIFNIVCRTLPS